MLFRIRNSRRCPCKWFCSIYGTPSVWGLTEANTKRNPTFTVKALSVTSINPYKSFSVEGARDLCEIIDLLTDFTDCLHGTCKDLTAPIGRGVHVALGLKPNVEVVALPLPSWEWHFAMMFLFSLQLNLWGRFRLLQNRTISKLYLFLLRNI